MWEPMWIDESAKEGRFEEEEDVDLTNNRLLKINRIWIVILNSNKNNKIIHSNNNKNNCNDWIVTKLKGYIKNGKPEYSVLHDWTITHQSLEFTRQ